MAIYVKINFDDCYEIETLTSDLMISKFDTEIMGGRTVPIGVIISNNAHPFLPDVHNLAFGPIEGDSRINDAIRIRLTDHSRTFTTVILTALAFLSKNKQKYLGVDGSDNVRAYLYYRVIQNNYELLTQYFEIYGVNYYVRILRKDRDSDDSHPIDPEDIEAIPRVIGRHERISPEKLYNYFIFRLKDGR